MILKNIFIQILEESQFLGDLRIPLQPEACPRPRHTRWGVYYPAKYKKWRKTALEVCPAGQLRSQDPLLVLVEHVAKRPKNPANPYPFQDLDNFDKSVYDAVTDLNGYWQDDKQVVTGMSWKRYARPGEDEGILVEFYKMKEERL